MTYKPAIVLAWMKSQGLPEPTLEFRFCESRRWRFDFSWLPQMVALEVEGGVWSRGRHGRGSGIVKDIEKYNAASVAGWTVLRVLPKDLCTETTATMLRMVL